MRVTAVTFEKSVQELLAPLPFLAPMGPLPCARLISALGTASNWRLLLRRVLLHLPRFSDEQLNDATVLEEEVHRRAAELSQLRKGIPESVLGPRRPDACLHKAVLESVPNDIAGLVHRSWHYLATARNGVHLGLYARPGGRPEDLLALATLSPLDVPHLLSIVPDARHPGSALVVSRLVAAEGAPRNTISHTMGRIFTWLRQNHSDVRVLLSYLNPNLAFRGSVYRASNWHLLMREIKRCVYYIDGNYVTDREVIRRFGTNDPDALRRHGAGQVSTSVQPLQPLDVFAYFLHLAERRRAHAACVRDTSPILVREGDAAAIYETQRKPALL
ncbi:hypothetical protein WME98_30645 [Sorangium sp. So ce296]|uniref:Mom family adenine methylcarbamoylation protein n=1 Tax=Sorangium sp. So ce296 TaxID=3133296 RepID=UPI003F5E353D